MAAFTVIDHTELTGTTAYWEETSISSSYDHLLIIVSARVDSGSATYPYENIKLMLNSDSSTTYSYTSMQGFTPTLWSGRGTSTGYSQWMYAPGADALADTFGYMTYWIPHYANTDNYTQVIGVSGFSNNSTVDWKYGNVTTATLYPDDAAISAVRLTPLSGEFVEYSDFTLYGITGA